MTDQIDYFQTVDNALTNRIIVNRGAGLVLTIIIKLQLISHWNLILVLKIEEFTNLWRKR